MIIHGWLQKEARRKLFVPFGEHMELMNIVYSAAGTALLSVASVNGFLMLETTGRKPTGEGFRRAHKWLGWLYVVLFAFLFIAMFPRVSFLEGMHPATLCHVVSGFSLLPLLLVKILVARRYRLLYASLSTLGFLVLYFTYMTVVTSGFYIVFFKPMS